MDRQLHSHTLSHSLWLSLSHTLSHSLLTLSLSLSISQVGDSVADYCIYITGGGTKGTSGFDFAAAYESSPLKIAADNEMRVLVRPR